MTAEQYLEEAKAESAQQKPCGAPGTLCGTRRREADGFCSYCRRFTDPEFVARHNRKFDAAVDSCRDFR